MEKMKETNQIEIRMGEVDIARTSRVGFMPKASYSDICKVFGMPQYLENKAGYKTQAEWQGKINGQVFTIYDYKTEVDAEDNTDWHIGGHKRITAELVNTYFKVVRTINRRKK